MSANQPMAALDGLRTVEFRQTLRGYHIDDVDEYLERVAGEAESLQEQFRQMSERLRQASDRIAQLEQQRQEAPGTAGAASGVTEDALQRTLMLAQKFVDQTQAEAEAQAQSTVEDAEQRASITVAEAEAKARSIVEGAELRLREEVARLESLRIKLVDDVDTVSQYLDGERTRLRGFLGEMLRWVDENVQPSANVGTKAVAESGRNRAAQGSDISDTGRIPASPERENSPPMSSMASSPTGARPADQRQGIMTLGQGANTPNVGSR